MGHAHYEITRADGVKIEAGYGVEAVCEEPGCDEPIDRGLGCLCGTTPGTPEDGCGGYYCGHHLYGANHCKRCAEAADKANAWTDPDTGEEFDLRDHFLPVGTRYDARGQVWKHLGEYRGGVPVLTPVLGPDFRPTGAQGKPISEGEWEDAARVAYRQMHSRPV